MYRLLSFSRLFLNETWRIAEYRSYVMRVLSILSEEEKYSNKNY